MNCYDLIIVGGGPAGLTLRQTVTACGEGAAAAYSAGQYLELRGGL